MIYANTHKPVGPYRKLRLKKKATLCYELERRGERGKDRQVYPAYSSRTLSPCLITAVK